MSTPPPPAPREESGGNVLQQRMGPFATWVWLLIGTVLVLGYAYFRSRKSSAQPAQAAAGQAVPSQQVPDIIIQNQEGPDQDATPPPQGSVPPTSPPPSGGGGGTKPPVKPPTKPPTGPPSGKPPTGGGTKKPPKFKIVTVARWTEDNAPWNSTLWGIAQHEGVKGGWQELAKLNGIKNPRQITAGQKIRVPA